MAEEQSMEDVANELAEALGVDEGQGEPSSLDEFYSEAEKAIKERHPEYESKDAPEEEGESSEASESEPQKFVHEPTGREFENELDYLRYNSGWTADRLGTENKELKERLEKLETRGESREEQPRQQDPKQIMKEIWPNLDEEMYDDPAVKMMYQGLDKAAGLMQQQFDQKLSSLKEHYEGLQSQFEADKVRAQFGVAPDVEQKLLEKHPGLKALPPQDRLAVMKDLSASNGQAEKASPKLVDKVPQRSAEDHVEGSAISGAPDDTDVDEILESKFFEMDEGKRLSVLGQMFEQNEFGRSLKDDDF